jgi:hypothetical protein
MIKAMLNGDTGVVEYDTSQKMDIAKKFVFTGKVIMLLNDLPKDNEHLKAVENRVLVYRLKLSRDEIIRLLYERAKREEVEGINLNERLAIVDFIKENTFLSTPNLNYRMYEKAINFFFQDKANWKELLTTQIERQEEHIELVIQNIPQEDWCKKTGMSRATYYRIRQNLGIENKGRWG